MSGDDPDRDGHSTVPGLAAQLQRAGAGPRTSTGAAAPVLVLVVDDDRRVRQSLRDLLASSDRQVLTAGSGADALDALSRHSIDLVLLDLHLPDMDGFEVMRALDARHADVDVIIISGETTFETATEALRAGARDFLRKPYAPSELLRLVDHTIDKRRMQHDLRAANLRLAASEQRYRFLVNNSPDIIYMLDTRGHFSFVNQRIERLLGFSPAEVLGQHYSMLIQEEDQIRASWTFNERRTGRRASTNLEIRLCCKASRTDYRHFETHCLDIEFSAMGIYASSKPISDSFLGTYGVARDITERKRAAEIINFQLYHDLLTRLPNRARFRDRLHVALARTRRQGQRLAIMFLDMDRFKVVNDSLGHLAGDHLLQQVATRLRACIREGDTLARVGGDEFNLLLPDIHDPGDAECIAAKIFAAFRSPLLVEGQEVFVSLSIGIAMAPEDGAHIDELIRHADMAMYHVKRHGRNSFAFFSASMHGAYRKHLSVETALRKALDERQFELYFQPQIQVDNGRVCGMEALLRWNDPERGLVTPGDFIPLAEETGLITDIGAWALDAACRELRGWQDIGHHDLVMAVNISAAQLSATGFENLVLGCVERHGIRPGHLELEITENLLMQDMDQAVSKLRALAGHGIRIAVDDFGVGYSSLGYLQKLPLNTLKIDRSFIQEVSSSRDRNSIITAIHAISRELGLDVVAEGVETAGQMDYLRALGCPRAQGYLLGRPMPAEAARARIVLG